MVKKNLNLKSYINIKRKKNGVEYNGVFLSSSLKVSGDNNKVEEYFKCSGKNVNFPHKIIKCPFEGKCSYLYGNRPPIKIEVLVNHSNDCPSMQKNKKEKDYMKKKNNDSSDSLSSNSNKSIIVENDINFFYLCNNSTCPVINLGVFLNEFEKINEDSDYSDDNELKFIESEDEKNMNENLF